MKRQKLLLVFAIWASLASAQDYVPFGVIYEFNSDNGTCNSFETTNANFTWKTTHGSPHIKSTVGCGPNNYVVLEAQKHAGGTNIGEGIYHNLNLYEGYHFIEEATYEFTVFYEQRDNDPGVLSGLQIKVGKNPTFTDGANICGLESAPNKVSQEIYKNLTISETFPCISNSITAQFTPNDNYEYFWMLSQPNLYALANDPSTSITIRRININAIAPPPDTDGDGIWDHLDDCPLIAGFRVQKAALIPTEIALVTPATFA